MKTYRSNPEFKALWAGCESNNADALPKLVLADWLEERGHESEARALRWMAENDKWPAEYKSLLGTSYKSYYWGGYTDYRDVEKYPIKRWELPWDIYNRDHLKDTRDVRKIWTLVVRLGWALAKWERFQDKMAAIEAAYQDSVQSS